MFVAGLVRQVWQALLAVTPAPVLARLDGWARHQAERKAARRRQALQARG